MGNDELLKRRKKEREAFTQMATMNMMAFKRFTSTPAIKEMDSVFRVVAEMLKKEPVEKREDIAKTVTFLFSAIHPIMLKNFILLRDSSTMFILFFWSYYLRDLYGFWGRDARLLLVDINKQMLSLLGLRDDYLDCMANVQLGYYHKHGGHFYSISPDLAWKLYNTDLRKMPMELVRSPYASIYIALPVEFDIQFNGETVCGLFIEQIPMQDGSDFCFSLQMSNMDLKFTTVEMWIDLTKGITIDECIDKIDDRVLDKENAPKDTVELKKMFRFAVNVVLYATHPDAEAVCINNTNPDFAALYKKAKAAKGQRKRKLLNDIDSTKCKPTILLGGSVVVSREEKEACASSGLPGAKLTSRCYVAAHWRHVWSGPMDGERKCTYQLISSFWRGPMDGLVSNKTHVMQ